MPKSPSAEPDEYGRLRVRDKDTGHVRSIHAEELPHGNYEVLSDPASDLNGDPMPVEYGTPRVPAVEPTENGQSADPKKENVND